MKKIKVFGLFIVVTALLLLNSAPAFALGEVDVGTSGNAPAAIAPTPPPVDTSTSTSVATVPVVTPTVTITTPQPSTPPVTASTTTTTTVPDTTSTAPSTQTTTNTSTTVGSTTITTQATPSTIVPTETPTTTTVTVPTVVTVSDTIPPVISGISSASVLPTEATVVWTTDELAVSHFRYGTTTNYGSIVTLGTTGLLVHAATMLNLSSNTTYHYCIDATDLFGNSVESCGHQFTTAAAAVQIDTIPPTIFSVTVAPITTTSATVSWTTNEIADGEVEFGTTASYGSIAEANTNYALADSTVLNNLYPDTLYHYRVHSHDESGNSAYSPDEVFTTVALAPTTAPTTTVTVPNTSTTTSTTTTPAPAGTPSIATPTLVISAIEVSPVTTTSAIINWTTDIPGTSQVQYGNSDALGSQTLPNNTLTTNHSVTITNLIPNTNYIFRVQSQPLGATVATVSALHEFNTLSEPVFVSTPAVITSLSSSAVTTNASTINWATNTATTGQIEYGITTGYGQVNILSVAAANHSVSLADLAPDTTYHFRVKAINTTGDITYSGDQTFTTLLGLTVSPSITSPTSTPITSAPSVSIPEPVAAPQATTTLAISSHDTTSATLSWNAVTADSDAGMFYDVRYSTAPITGTNWNAATSVQTTRITYGDLVPNGTMRNYLVAGLTPSTTYYFAIKAKYEASDWSTISNTVSTTLATQHVSTHTSTASQEAVVLPISHPIVLNATGLDSQIVLNWNNSKESNFVRTIIVRTIGGYAANPADGLVIYEGDGGTFTDTVLTNGTMYYYTFYSYDHNKHYSDPTHVSVKPVASLGAGGSGVSGGAIGQIAINESPVIVPSTTIDHFTSIWKKGDKDLEVEHLQQVLLVNGQYYPKEIIDGKFGTFTEKGLKQFQATYHLPQTGITDPATQQQLNIASQSLVKMNVPGDLTVFDIDLSIGAIGPAVEDLQQFLADEGSHTDIIDGMFGKMTQLSVQVFQNKYNIKPATGAVGPRTRHIMRVISGF